jgi:hypothetical protein
MEDNALFALRDLKVIEALVYNPSLEPGYELLKGCLIWRDEMPDNITPQGWDVLGTLWGARAQLHNINAGAEPWLPGYGRETWDQAMKEITNWPGFKRLTLSEKDWAYWEEEQRSFEESDGDW